MEDQFKPGDVVQLKSGGEHMTVEAHAGKIVVVVWFNPIGKVVRDRFYADTLTKAAA